MSIFPATLPSCAGNCQQGTAPCTDPIRCCLVMTSPHGRLVDTDIHEAPVPRPACALPSPKDHMQIVIAYRLFRFYRQSGLPFSTAVARAWAKRK